MGRLELHVAPLAGLLHLLHVLGPPALLGHHPGGQALDAAMRTQPELAARKLRPNSDCAGRVVHVDGMRIGEVHLDEAQRVLRARLLAVGQALGVGPLQLTLVGSSLRPSPP